MATEGSTTRLRHADLVRATAIWAVVVGHWLVVAVTGSGSDLGGTNALGQLTWAHPLTWAFQVMPLFFFVGGYANAASLARHRARGGDGLGWVAQRHLRLLGPSLALVAVLVAGFVAARAAGIDAEVAGDGAWLATVPLWFLAAYLAVLAAAPLTLALHRRAPLVVPVGAAAVVAAADAARFRLDDPPLASVTYLVAWLGIHQLGYAWHDGRLPARPKVGAALAAAGAVAAVGLTAAGPYPISMVRVPGADFHNTEPPSAGLLALAVAQIGVVLAAQRPATRWLARPRPWRAVTAVQATVLTLFLWHMAAAVGAAAVLHGTGLVPESEVGSGRWLVLRVPWLGTCAAILGVLVAALRPLERAARRPVAPRRIDGAAPRSLAAVGVAAGLAGTLLLAVAGSGAHGPLGLPTGAVAACAVAVGALGLVRRRAAGTDRDGAAGPGAPSGQPARPSRRAGLVQAIWRSSSSVAPSSHRAST